MSVIQTVEQEVCSIGGRDYPVTITRYKGLRTYKTADGREILADEAAYFDYGPKLGGGWNYSLHHDYTEEQRAEGRRHIQAVAVQAMVDQGLW